MNLKVSEKFYSIQGEGKSAGVPAYFLRLKSCNLLCGGIGTDKDGQLHDGATWRCDTIEVWLKGSEISVNDIAVEYLEQPKHTRLIITGGEPLLQQKAIIELLELIPPSRLIEIETNGTIMPDPYLWNRVQWNVSPKLANSGMSKEKRIHGLVLNRLAQFDSQFKFVISNADDLDEVFEIIHAHDLPRAKIWLMPAAETREQLYEVGPRVIALAKQHGLNFSNRLHIQIWDAKTGV
jgi:6-pyruvoyltetrahydropterin 2'-reductase